VVIGGCVLDGIVQHCRSEDRSVLDPEEVADDQADAEGMTGIGRLAVLAELPLVGAGSKGDGFQQSSLPCLQRGHQSAPRNGGDSRGQSRSSCSGGAWVTSWLNGCSGVGSRSRIAEPWAWRVSTQCTE